MTSPILTLLLWLDDQPVEISRFLAHFFRVCSTENTSVIAEEPYESLDKFKIWMIKHDFPMRRLAKLMHAVTIFDLAINHREKILHRTEFKALFKDGNVLDFTSAQWDRTFEAWQKLRSGSLSDSYINIWADLVIDNKVED